jgi:phosphatidylinositol alpha-mannosyltransferase
MSRAASRPAILFVDHGEWLGGSGVSLASSLQSLAPYVRRVVAVPDGKTRRLIDEHHAADRVVSIPPLRTLGVRGVASLMRASARIVLRTRDEHFVAVHANGLVDLGIAALLGALRRVGIVVWLHDADVGDRRISRVVPIVRRMVPFIRWAAVSEAAADAAAASGLAERREILIVPNPIALARRRGSPREKVSIGYLGSDSERKGFDLLPQVARALDPERAELRLFTKRHTDITAELGETWAELECEPTVTVVGRVEDVSAAFAECDVVICPSRAESFCRVAAEAMVSGVAVVGSDIPALREVLAGGDAGILVPVGDGAALAAAVTRLVDDPARRAALVEVGRKQAQRYRPDIVAAGLLECYGVRV